MQQLTQGLILLQYSDWERVCVWEEDDIHIEQLLFFPPCDMLGSMYCSLAIIMKGLQPHQSMPV